MELSHYGWYGHPMMLGFATYHREKRKNHLSDVTPPKFNMELPHVYNLQKRCSVIFY